MLNDFISNIWYGIWSSLYFFFMLITLLIDRMVGQIYVWLNNYSSTNSIWTWPHLLNIKTDFSSFSVLYVESHRNSWNMTYVIRRTPWYLSLITLIVHVISPYYNTKLLLVCCESGPHAHVGWIRIIVHLFVCFFFLCMVTKKLNYWWNTYTMLFLANYNASHVS